MHTNTLPLRGRRRAFTLLEVGLAVGIIAVVSSIIIVALNPKRISVKALDASRLSVQKQVSNALQQYFIDNKKYPDATKLREGTGSEMPLCKQGALDTTNCISVSNLVPTYLPALPQDRAMTCSNFSGYYVYTLKGEIKVDASHILGKDKGEVSSDECFLTDTWTGSAGDSSWSNTNNWTLGVPVQGSNIIIPAGKSTYPTVPNSPNPTYFHSITVAGTLTIASSTNLTVMTGATISVSGTLRMQNSATLNVKGGSTFTIATGGQVSEQSGYGSSSIVLDQTSFMNVSGTLTLNSSMTLQILNSSVLNVLAGGVVNVGSGSVGTLTLSSKLNVLGTLNVTNGSNLIENAGAQLTVQSGGTVSLQSSAITSNNSTVTNWITSGGTMSLNNSYFYGNAGQTFTIDGTFNAVNSYVNFSFASIVNGVMRINNTQFHHNSYALTIAANGSGSIMNGNATDGYSTTVAGTLNIYGSAWLYPYGTTVISGTVNVLGTSSAISFPSGGTATISGLVKAKGGGIQEYENISVTGNVQLWNNGATQSVFTVYLGTLTNAATGTIQVETSTLTISDAATNFVNNGTVINHGTINCKSGNHWNGTQCTSSCTTNNDCPSFGNKSYRCDTTNTHTCVATCSVDANCTIANTWCGAAGYCYSSCTQDNECHSGDFCLGSTCHQLNTFQGTINSNWSTAGNWSTGHAPNSNDDVLIPAGLTVDVSSINSPLRNLTVAGNMNYNTSQSLEVTGAFSLSYGGTLSVNQGYVSIDNSFTNNGTLNINSGVFYGNGASYGSIDVSNGGTFEVMGYFTIYNGSTLTVEDYSYLTLDNTIEVQGYLNMYTNAYLYYNSGSITRNGGSIQCPANGSWNDSTGRCNFTFTWTGGYATDWNNASYWSVNGTGIGLSPQDGDSIYIPSGSSPNLYSSYSLQDVTVDGGQLYIQTYVTINGNLTVQNGGYMEFDNGNTTYVNGNVTVQNSSVLNVNSSNTVYFQSNLTIYSNSGLNVEYSSYLTVQGSAEIDDHCSVYVYYGSLYFYGNVNMDGNYNTMTVDTNGYISFNSNGTSFYVNGNDTVNVNYGAALIYGNSSWTNYLYMNGGTMNINNGGIFQLNGYFYMGNNWNGYYSTMNIYDGGTLNLNGYQLYLYWPGQIYVGNNAIGNGGGLYQYGGNVYCINSGSFSWSSYKCPTTYTWTGNAWSSDWWNSSNWTVNGSYTGGTPQNGDSVYIPSYTSSGYWPYLYSWVDLTDLTIDGGQLYTYNGIQVDGALYVQNSGYLSLQNSYSYFYNTTYITNGGTVDVSNSATLYIYSYNNYLQYGGHLNVSNSSTIYAYNYMYFDGNGSTIDIGSGGNFTNYGYLYLYGSDSITIEGGGTLNLNNYYIYFYGSSRLNLHNGFSFNNYNNYMYFYDSSSAQCLDGGTWNAGNGTCPITYAWTGDGWSSDWWTSSNWGVESTVVMSNMSGYTYDQVLPGSGQIGASSPNGYGSINLSYVDGNGSNYQSVLNALQPGDTIRIQGTYGWGGGYGSIDATLVVSDATISQRGSDEYIACDNSTIINDLDGGSYTVTIHHRGSSNGNIPQSGDTVVISSSNSGYWPSLYSWIEFASLTIDGGQMTEYGGIQSDQGLKVTNGGALYLAGGTSNAYTNLYVMNGATLDVENSTFYMYGYNTSTDWPPMHMSNSGHITISNGGNFQLYYYQPSMDGNGSTIDIGNGGTFQIYSTGFSLSGNESMTVENGGTLGLSSSTLYLYSSSTLNVHSSATVTNGASVSVSGGSVQCVDGGTWNSTLGQCISMYTWTGAQNTLWSNANNWSYNGSTPGSAPGNGANVVIATSSNQPTFNGANNDGSTAISPALLQVNNGATLTTTVGMTVSSALAVHGVLNINKGTIATGNGSSGTVYSDGALNVNATSGAATFQTGNAVTLAGALRVKSNGTLSVPSGKSITNTGSGSFASGSTFSAAGSFANNGNLTFNYGLTISGSPSWSGSSPGCLNVDYFMWTGTTCNWSVGIAAYFNTITGNLGVESISGTGNYLYASAGNTNTLNVYDIGNGTTNPSLTLVTSVSTGASSNPSGITVVGHYAYVSLNGLAQLKVFDISNPANPTAVGSPLSLSTCANPYQSTTSKDQNTLYVLCTSSAPQSMKLAIVNITNKSAPTLSSIFTGFSGGNSTNQTISIARNGNYLYIGTHSSDWSTTDVYTLDVTTPTSPTQVNRLSDSSWQWGMAASGSYAFFSDRIGNRGIHILSLANPAAPTQVGYNGAGGNNHGIWVSRSTNFAAIPDENARVLTFFNTTTKTAPTVTQQVSCSNGSYLMFMYERVKFLYVANNSTICVVKLGTGMY